MRRLWVLEPVLIWMEQRSAPPVNFTTAAGVTLASEKITVGGGTLNLSTNGPVVVTAPSTLLGSYGGPISGTALITLSGGTLSGNNLFSANILIPSGAGVTAASTNALGDTIGTTTVSTGGSLILAGALAEPIFNNGVLQVNAAYSGPLISSGTVTVSAATTGSISITGGWGNFNVAPSVPLMASGASLDLDDKANPFASPISMFNAAAFAEPSTGGTVTVSTVPNVSGTNVFRTGAFKTVTLNFTAGIAGSGSLLLASYTGSAGNGSVNVLGPLDFNGNFSTGGVVALNAVNTTGTLNIGGDLVTLNGPTNHVGNLERLRHSRHFRFRQHPGHLLQRSIHDT